MLPITSQTGCEFVLMYFDKISSDRKRNSTSQYGVDYNTYSIATQLKAVNLARELGLNDSMLEFCL